MGLTEQLSNIRRGTQSVTNYLGIIRSLADELALIDAPVPHSHLINHTLNGIRPEFNELSAAVRARDKVISFEELHDKLVEYESYLKREENHSTSSIIANATRYNNFKNGNQN